MSDDELEQHSPTTAPSSTAGVDDEPKPLDELFSHDLQLSRRSVVIALVIFASFAVWAYAYSGFADGPGPDELEDTTFVETAEARCATTMAELDRLPLALEADDNVERADQVVVATDLLAEMVDDLEAAVDGTESDRQILGAWLDDWRLYLDDRYRYADAVREDPAAPFLISDTGGPERLEKRITRFAQDSGMPSCATPPDVGG